jgi:REP element-mobilizing transposase RayT
MSGTMGSGVILLFCKSHGKNCGMARRERIEYAGAFYHVITRGNQRQKTFRDDRDRAKYLEILAHLKEVNRFRVHAYVLMVNHVHLLVETGEDPLSRIMQRVGSGYTQYFNRRHKLVGHLFQGRYKAILCDKDSYLLELSRYLHLNPVRAKVVKEPGEYRWSSYGAYVQAKQCPAWMETAGVLQQFSERVRAREAICYVARRRTELSVKLLAESLEVDATCVSRSAGRVERLVADDKMQKMVNAVASVLINSKPHA